MSVLEKISRMPHISTASNTVVCIRNEGYEVDLKRLHIYEMIPDESLGPDDIRVIDETGEDYIYPANYFVSADQIEHGRGLYFSHL